MFSGLVTVLRRTDAEGGPVVLIIVFKPMKTYKSLLKPMKAFKLFWGATPGPTNKQAHSR